MSTGVRVGGAIFSLMLTQLDRVKTNKLRWERNMVDSRICNRCNNAQESTLHLVRDYNKARMLSL